MTAEQVRGLFSAFENTLDPDIEDFIRNKAFRFQQRKWSSVYFVVDADKADAGKMALEAYFTLSHKAIMLKDSVSKSQRKKIWGGIINDDPIAHFVLIGHLGKFIGTSYKSSITASEIIDFALEMIEDAQKRIAFGSILVECKDEPKLIEKYAEKNFVYLQDDELVQLMRRV